MVGTCNLDTDCSLARTNQSGLICSTGANFTRRLCACNRATGLDDCRLVGQCTAFCQQPAMLAQLARQNQVGGAVWLGVAGGTG